MLRRCFQRAPSLPLRRSTRCLPAAGQTHHHLNFSSSGQRRSYGLSRHPDPLAPRVDLNTVEEEDTEIGKWIVNEGCYRLPCFDVSYWWFRALTLMALLIAPLNSIDEMNV